jgi:hypothetical protein
MSIQNRLLLPLAMILLLATQPHTWADGLTRNPQWFACGQTAECVLDTAPCGGPQAVNRKFVTEYQDWYKRIAPVVDCAGVPYPNKVCISCKNHVCTVETEK